MKLSVKFVKKALVAEGYMIQIRFETTRYPYGVHFYELTVAEAKRLHTAIGNHLPKEKS